MILEIFMKIDPKILDNVLLRPQKDQSNPLGQAGQVEDFASILANSEAGNPLQGQVSGMSSEQSSASLWAASLLGKIQAGQAASVTSTPQISGMEDEIGDVLDMLEKYMSALGDPQVTLKEISPMVEDLDRSAVRLDKLAASLGQSDPIKQLTNETAALAAVEALKFKRGDFV
jgi:hypothetical protein